MMVFKVFILFIFLMVLRCVTFNARGLLDFKKFERVTDHFKNQDIILLQETNWKDDILMDYRKKWEGWILHNNGDGKCGRGVAILMKSDVFKESKVLYKDGKGKCMVVEVNYEGKKIVFVNVHAPTEEKEKKGFFNHLREFLKDYKEIVIAGDFNTVFSKQDMAEGMVFKSDMGRK